MDVLLTMLERRSARAFTDEVVGRDTLTKILHTASQAPSAINMQPWEIHVATGEERKRLSRRLWKSYRERQVTCGPGSKAPIPEKFVQRARECAEQMTPLIEESGSEFKRFINEGSLDFYGAPAVVLIFLDDSFAADAMIDVGTFTAYLVLAAAAEGLGTCPIGLVKAYGDEIKDHLNIAESKVLALSVAIGKTDPGAPINRFRSARVPVADFVRWID
ncbi:MAG: nitroreductase [Pseudomonadota bacterium]